MILFIPSPGSVRTPAAWAVVLLLAFSLGMPRVSAADVPASANHPTIPDTIQQRAMACTSCHGVHGEGAPDSSDGPRLAGKPAGYLLQQLRYFQNGQRKNPAMEYVLRQLDTTFMRELASYFATQQVAYRQPTASTVSVASLQRGEQLALHGDPSIGVPACNSCHGKTLTGVQPRMPGLIGLSDDYIAAQLVSWRSHTRAAKEPFCMGVVANRLHAADVGAIAAWLASRPATAQMKPQPARTQGEALPGWCVMGDSGDGS